MQCPACQTPLERIEIASDLALDACTNGCRGIWFDNQELQALDDADEFADSPVLELIAADAEPDSAPQSQAARLGCPRCAGIKMRRFWYTASRQVEVDQCGQCGGCWLDRGELGRVRAEYRSAADREAGVARQVEDLLAPAEAEQDAMTEAADARLAGRRRGRLSRALDRVVAHVAEWL
ncbi:MAG: zf-TFIIB domain-containing protein [Candidatus Sericytochromatia bacterium]|nr:zf-TFIIB domain-containing protein [Candidatus Sericytochromatia bacterium]